MSKLFPPYTPPPRPVHPLEARIGELRALQRDYIAEQIKLTADGARIDSPAPSDRRELRALELLRDFLPTPPQPKPKAKRPAVDPAERLKFLLAEQSAIERAIDIAGQRLTDARLDMIREYMIASAADWNENTRQLAITIATLWQLNRQRETLRTKAGNPSRATAGIHHRQLLGLGAPGENQSAVAKQFITEALEAGVVTEREIAHIIGA